MNTLRAQPCRTVIESLEPRRLLASRPIGIWTGAGDGINWHDPLNWSQNTLPGINDDVVLDVPARPTILVSQPVALRSINSSEVLEIVSEFSIQQESQFHVPVRLEGSLRGTGEATFASCLDWNGGILEAGGRLIIAAGAELNVILPGGPPGVLTHELYRSIDNFGTVNLRTFQPATFAVSGCYFHNQAGGVVNLLQGAVTLIGETAVVRNSGTFNIHRETFLESNLEFVNDGTVDLKGELHLHVPGSSSGKYIVGGWLSFLSHHTLLEDSLLTGVGAVNFYATATVDGAVSGLNLLAIATAKHSGVAFNGPVAVDHLVCINESSLPDLPIARFNGATVVGDVDIVAGHVQLSAPFTSSRTLVRAYQERPATLELATYIPDLGDVEINDSTVQLQSGERPYRTLRVTSLAGSGSWDLDLGNGAMVVDYTGVSPLSQIRAALTSGYGEGGWNGVGINSSDAGLSSDHALGYSEATDLYESSPAPFAGLEVDDTSVLVRHTLYGDTNLDREVNLLDFNRLAANFGADNTLWSEGDFNFDATTDLIDFNLLASSFGEPLVGSPSESIFTILSDELR